MVKIKVIEFVLYAVTTLAGVIKSIIKLIDGIGKLRPKAKATV